MKLIVALVALSFAAAPVLADNHQKAAGKPAAAKTEAPKADNADCEAKAVDKNGKPLAGAAKASFLKKCQQDAKGPQADAAKACEAKAAEKKLAGAAKNSFVKKCEKDAVAAK